MEINTELQEIMEESSTRPNNCNCSDCQNMCTRSPCLGTPSDILRLAESGHGDKLQVTQWAVGNLYFNWPIINMIQLRKTEHGCIMFKDGKCTLHSNGLKPTEGVLAHHANRHEVRQSHVNMVVAKSWINDDNVPKIEKLIKFLYPKKS